MVNKVIYIYRERDVIVVFIISNIYIYTIMEDRFMLAVRPVLNIYIYIYTYECKHIYIYIYRERERFMCVYTYIYNSNNNN